VSTVRVEAAELPDPWERARPHYLRVAAIMGAAQLPNPMAPNLGFATIEATLKRIDDAAEATDWGDGPEDSDDSVTPTPERRRVARNFVRLLALIAEERLGAALPTPEFWPAANGGVDVHWGPGGSRELLLGVRPEGVEATFFGKASDGTTIKGLVRLDEPSLPLAAWLLQSP
jgi:hypothetical protein